MKYISDNLIKRMAISPLECVHWVEESFLLKSDSILPHKTSLQYGESHYFNIMPVVIPKLNVMGVKMVNRYPQRFPSVDGDIALYNYETGNLLAILDGFWITNARTGAVAALSCKSFAPKDFTSIAFIGLGNTATATLFCILSLYPNNKLKINLLKYKDHTSSFIKKFEIYKNIEFSIFDDVHRLVNESDVIISSVTNAQEEIASPDMFKKGALLIPIHTKGFQRCDLTFDKIFGDDRSHIEGFHFFKLFKQFYEFSSVLSGVVPGRENDNEQIICYNIGIAMHDIIFAHHIYNLIEKSKINCTEICQQKLNQFTF